MEQIKANRRGRRTKPFDEASLNRRLDELRTESARLGDMFEGLSEQEVRQMLLHADNGAGLKQFYEDWKVRATQQRQQEEERRAGLTAEDRLQEILRFPRLQRRSD